MPSIKLPSDLLSRTYVEPRSYKVEVLTFGDTEWNSNGLRFRTMQDATDYAGDLYSRWMAVKETRVVRSDDEPNRPEEGR